MNIILDATTAGRSVHTYRVTFTGDQADEIAAAWVGRKSSTHAYFGVVVMPQGAVRTLAALYGDDEDDLLDSYPPSDHYDDDVDHNRIANDYEGQFGW